MVFIEWERMGLVLEGLGGLVESSILPGSLGVGAVFAEYQSHMGRPRPSFWVWASKVPRAYLGSAPALPSLIISPSGQLKIWGIDTHRLHLMLAGFLEAPRADPRPPLPIHWNFIRKQEGVIGVNIHEAGRVICTIMQIRLPTTRLSREGLVSLKPHMQVSGVWKFLLWSWGHGVWVAGCKGEHRSPSGVWNGLFSPVSQMGN